MAIKKETVYTSCSVTHCMQYIGSTWKPIILFQVSKGTNRFTKLLKEMEGINRQMLSKQLKELEKSGILERKSFPEIPPRVEYSLTPLGKSLLPVVKSMQRWGNKHQASSVTKTDSTTKMARKQIGLFD